MGRHANAELYRQLEQQARRQYSEDEREEQEQEPRGFSDFYNWKLDAKIDRMKGQW